MSLNLPNIIRKHIVAFGDVFNDYYIELKSGEERKVPIRFSTDEKMISHLRSTDTAGERTRINTPVMGYNISSLDYNEERQQVPINKIIADRDSGDTSSQYVFNPVPYDFIFEMTLYTKYAVEMFQLIEQILPRFKKGVKYPLIEIKFTNGDQIQRDIPIVLDSTNLDFVTEDIGKEDERVLKTNMTFSVQGYLYSPITESSIINLIDLQYENVINEEMEAYDLDTGDDDTNIENQEITEAGTEFV